MDKKSELNAMQTELVDIVRDGEKLIKAGRALDKRRQSFAVRMRDRLKLGLGFQDRIIEKGSKS